MLRKDVITITHLLVILLTIGTVHLKANANEYDPPIVIPDQDCGDDCVDRIRVDEDGTIFVLRNSEFLYVIQNNEAIVFIELMQILPIRGIRRDFVPVGNDGTLLFFDYQALSDETVLFNYKTEMVKPIQLDIVGELIECSLPHLISNRSIVSIGGTDGAICSWDKGKGYINIIHYDGDNLSTSSLEIGTLPELNRRPWQHITGGQDGSLYIVPSGLTNISSIFEIQESSENTTVLKYAPSTTKWFTIELEQFSDRWQEVRFPPLVKFVGVDTERNLYFHYLWNHPEYTGAFNIVKYSANGTILWQIDETQIDSEVIQDIILISEDQLLIATSDSIKPVIIQNGIPQH